MQNHRLEGEDFRYEAYFFIIFVIFLSNDLMKFGEEQEKIPRGLIYKIYYFYIQMLFWSYFSQKQNFLIKILFFLCECQNILVQKLKM